MKLVVDFDPIHGNNYTVAAALPVLVYVRITNTHTNYPQGMDDQYQWRVI